MLRFLKQTGPAYLLRNETPTSNYWITLPLVGFTAATADGIGAEIKITTLLDPKYNIVASTISFTVR